MGDGGPPHRMLAERSAQVPLSIHGVALSIGGAGPSTGSISAASSA